MHEKEKDLLLTSPTPSLKIFRLTTDKQLNTNTKVTTNANSNQIQVHPRSHLAVPKSVTSHFPLTPFLAKRGHLFNPRINHSHSKLFQRDHNAN
jgi:hypothetical protein